MADTIVNNTPAGQPQDSGSAGWAVAVIILLIIIVGGYLWYRNHRVYVPVQQPNVAHINVTIPAPSAGTGNTAPAGTGSAGNTTNQ